MTTPVWKTRHSRVVFDASPRLKVWRQHVVTDRGEDVPDYYRVELPEFAIGCPYTEDGRVITLWQYKHGCGRESLTFPAGHIEPGETPAEAMARELLEETGYVPGFMDALGPFVVNGNQGCGTAHLFRIGGCRPVRSPQSGDLETSRLQLMTVADIDAAMAQGAIAILPHLAIWLAGRRANPAEEQHP